MSGYLAAGQVELICRRDDESLPVIARLYAFTPANWSLDVYRPNPRAIGGIGERLVSRVYQTANLVADLRRDELRLFDGSYLLDQAAMRRLRALGYELGALEPLVAQPGARGRLSPLAERLPGRQLARASG